MMLIPKNSFLILLLAFFFATLSCYINKGYFSVGGLVFLLLALLFLCLFPFFSKSKKLIPKQGEDLLKLLLFAFISLANLEFDSDMNGFLSLSMLVLRGGLILAMLTALIFLFNKQKSRLFFGLLFFLAIIIRLAVVRIVVEPKNDVFAMLKYAPLSLLKGENPYEHPESVPTLVENWQRPYPHFTYGPAVLFFFLPFNLLFGDPRYFLILTEALGALILYQLLDKRNLAGFQNLLPLIFLYYPQFIQMTKSAFLEPLIASLFFLGFWNLYKKKSYWAILAFACGIAVKWVYFLFLPFLFRFAPKKFIKGSTLLLAVLLLFYYPFLRQNFPALWESTIMYSLRDHTRWLNLASLTMQTWFNRQFHFVPKLIFWLPPMVAVLAWLLLTFKKRLSVLATATAAIILVFFLFSPQGMMHYYYFTCSLILLAMSLVVKEEDA